MKTNLLGYKYVYSFMLCITMLFSYSISWGQGFEDFSNSNATPSYSDNSFLGNNGITWTFVESRDGNGDANSSGINLPALMLRRSSDNSAVTSSSISGGIGNFSVKLYKGFTGSGNRQVELFVNGVSQGTSTPFDDFNEHVFTVNNIDISGDITIEIRNITSNQIIVDDITWTAAAPTVGPQITNITTTPAGGITSSDAVTVSADVIDAAGIANVALKWGTTSGSLSNSLTMANTTADVYEAIIPAQADGTTVYYALEAENTTGDTNTSTEMSYTVEDPVVVNLPYTVDATTVNPFTDGWTTQDLAGGNSWQYNTGSGVSMNAYSDNCDAEDWLITPAFDLSATANELLSFELYENYSGTSIDVLYSTNYDGVSDPNTATWTNITTIQSGNSGVITDNISLQGLSANKVYVAFLYEGTGGSCSEWELTNFSLEEGVTTPTILTSTASLTGLNYMDANGPSAAQSFDLSGLFLDGTQDVTVEILMGDFEVSLDDVTYADSLTLTNYDGTTTPIYVRLKAGYSQDTYEDFILINGYGLTEIEVSLEGEVTPFSEEYAGIGVFELISSNAELTDGYYVITNESSEYLMTNMNTTVYFTHEEVTVSNDKIEDPIADNVWYIEANGGGYTIYNEVTQKYVGWHSGNSASEDVTVTDNARWTFDYQSGKFTVNNLNTPERQLSYNPGAPRFAAYGNSGQHELQLYKIVESPTADYTYTSGSWSPEDPNGMASPTDNIEVLDGTATFNNAIGINNLSIATGATLEVKDVLTVNGNITNDGNIIFKSTAIKTAQLDEFNGTISGNGDVVVERFIPAKRAFRLLSSPVNGQTFADAWQQNTHITGVGGAANGFDPTSTNNPSLFIFNNSSQTQAGGAAWEAVTSTTESINAGQGYRLMVRGDRTIDLTSQNPTPTPTTLMSKGDLTTGNYTPTLAQGAGFYSLIGNPYQAIVDFSQLTFSGDINNSNIYVWDPTMTGSNDRGAYVTVDVASNSPSPSSSEANKYIMPGQAFFVQNNAEINQAPSITFTENAKVTAQSQTSVFSTIDEFYVNFRLYKSSALQNDESESDAIGLRFADYYTTPSSDEDASKLANPGENFAVVNDKFTSIDKRAMPLDNEEIELFISGYEAQNYDIKFMLGHQPEDIKLYLNDNYLESSVEISDDMIYSFSVDSNSPASIAADRFYISFENVTMGTTQPNLADAIRIYPNPAADVLNIDVKNYEIEKLKIFNIQGQELNSVSSTKSINVSSLKSGVYILKVYTNQGTSVQKFIKK